MRINYNSMAFGASNNYQKIGSNLSKAMERLSSGYKINSPSDDAAGLAISLKMDSQIRGLKRAGQNTNDGVSVIQSSEGGLGEIHSILQRMRELAVQAANDVNSEDDTDAIQEEINNLAEEINQIVDTTAFNGQKLLNGNLGRRSISSSESINASYISQEVKDGVYELQVTADATKAKVIGGNFSSGQVITADMVGYIKVNEFIIEINEGDTMSDIYDTLKQSLDKINIDVFASVDGVTEEPFASADFFVLQSKEYGSNQEIKIDVSNLDIATAIGIADNTSSVGTDCAASLVINSDGFSTTATASLKGNEITVIDRNGFEMKFDVEPEAVANHGIINSSIEVLSAGTLVVQTGGNNGEQLSIEIPSVNATNLDVDQLIMYTNGYASEAITKIDEAIKTVSGIRSKLGAYQNRLEDIDGNLDVQGESLTEAYSRIMDTDMAEAMTEYTQQDVLSQAAMSMMKKSNERPESILQLLQ